MELAGIVAEYNPFHLGHKLHIEKTRSFLGENTAVVCIMSGNFTQRGDFAAFEKHARAEAAVRCGADLVLELPLPWALSSAESFALGAVSVLHSLGNVTHLSFGSEAGAIPPLKKAADCLLSEGIDDKIKAELKSGVSYAAARQAAVLKSIGSAADVLKSPNNILGVEYIKALTNLNSLIEPITFERIGAGHDSGELSATASASKIRDMLKNGGDAFSYMPQNAAAVILSEIGAGRGPVFSENCESAILSQLRRMSKSDFYALGAGEEGLSDRLYKYSRTAPTLEAFLMSTKTKRYPLSRIRRIIIRAYLGLSTDLPERPPYARILAIGKRGREIVKTASKEFTLITKPASVKRLTGESKRLSELEALSTDLYSLAYPDASQRLGGLEYTLGPRVITKSY